MSHARCACPREGQCTRPSEHWRWTSTPETQHMKLNTCDVPPDLGLHWGLHRSLQQLEKPAAALRSSARRPRHATKATNSLATLGSLQGLPRRARHEEGEPPGDTRALFRQGGAPQRLQRGGKGYSGGRLRRRRDTRRGSRRHRVHNRTLTHRRGRNETLLDATQLGRNATRRLGRRLDARTLIRTNARRLSDARNTHGMKTRGRRTRVDHGVVNCG